MKQILPELSVFIDVSFFNKNHRQLKINLASVQVPLPSPSPT